MFRVSALPAACRKGRARHSRGVMSDKCNKRLLRPYERSCVRARTLLFRVWLPTGLASGAAHSSPSARSAPHLLVRVGLVGANGVAIEGVTGNPDEVVAVGAEGGGANGAELEAVAEVAGVHVPNIGIAAAVDVADDCQGFVVVAPNGLLGA